LVTVIGFEMEARMSRRSGFSESSVVWTWHTITAASDTSPDDVFSRISSIA
jgi:hypothetical protein